MSHVIALVLTAAVFAAAAAAAAEGPCDILVAAGNPCVAAHSTVRALYAKYVCGSTPGAEQRVDP